MAASPPRCRLLQGLQGLEQGLAAERGIAEGLPPMTRALARGRAVATHLATLLTVFDARHFSEPEADIALEPVGNGTVGVGRSGLSSEVTLNQPFEV